MQVPVCSTRYYTARKYLHDSSQTGSKRDLGTKDQFGNQILYEVFSRHIFFVFMLPSLHQPRGRSIIDFLATEFAISLRFKRKSENNQQPCLRRMFIIPPIFTSDGMTECSYLFISLAELAANSNLYIVVSLVIEFEISVVFSGWGFVFKMIKMGWK